MPPRHRSSSGYRGVHVHPSDTFYVEIRSDGVRLSLGTFETAHKAVRAYDAAAWRLSRQCSQMNFDDDAQTCEQAQELAPPPQLVTDGNRQEPHRQQRRVLIAEADEQAMAEWRQRYPQDVADEKGFTCQLDRQAWPAI
ncbi:ethylene-responsive transcription factor ERF115-like [Aegilops tauschii subsp. strangulata]|uniref:ethylene-responsive transcription factor ERF115-like n=1 Tax=Aegilops tauschii subsp. strangulata TaxID=200361 RepID=UPI00098B7086|nr:ethylene-responsive transcription factor ERF098-like [Aegilops tauschii subsp. strangulata]